MPRPTAAPRRYAEALFQLAQAQDTLDAWGDDLRLAAALLGDERVRSIVDNPAIPFEKRRPVLDALLATRASRAVRNLAAVLAQRNRVELLPQIAREYQHLLNRHRGVVEAVVTTAAPLTADETQAVRERIEQMTRAGVDLRTEVDEALIGGLTIRVGDRLLDASVRGRLERLREQLLAGTLSR